MLRGTARIGLKALFPNQGPRATYPCSLPIIYETSYLITRRPTHSRDVPLIPVPFLDVHVASNKS
jgi:hypothetical protein